jgi:L,D-peptidoglycan transpeptidase YkuD (ErfK/YbiS/YcfS/YnhG family)
MIAAFASAAVVCSPPRTSAATKPVDRRALPPTSTQMVLGLADSWSSTKVTLHRLGKSAAGWARVGRPIPARIGPTGLAWGVGLLQPSAISAASADHPGKVEGDDTAPVGVFRLGPVFAYDASWEQKTAMPFVRVGPRDLFVEDPASPLYNTHVRLDHLPQTEWEKHEQMQQGDAAHRLKVFVGHNANPPVGGRGSAIFLHVWRNEGAVPTAGCTAMGYSDLGEIVKWLRPGNRPLYVLVPRSVYREIRTAWKLPDL